MGIDDTTLDLAYSIYDEFGPNRAIHRAARLQQEFPGLSAEAIALLVSQMSEVSKTVSEVASQGGERKLGQARVLQLLQSKHPFLRHQGLGHALFLVNYYAWREGC